jgi:hypothetical protein
MNLAVADAGGNPVAHRREESDGARPRSKSRLARLTREPTGPQPHDNGEPPWSTDVWENLSIDS